MQKIELVIKMNLLQRKFQKYLNKIIWNFIRNSRQFWVQQKSYIHINQFNLIKMNLLFCCFSSVVTTDKLENVKFFSSDRCRSQQAKSTSSTVKNLDAIPKTAFYFLWLSRKILKVKFYCSKIAIMKNDYLVMNKNCISNPSWDQYICQDHWNNFANWLHFSTQLYLTWHQSKASHWNRVLAGMAYIMSASLILSQKVPDPSDFA